MNKLVIIESPAKIKTIKKYLGKGYEVIASMGHFRDLPKSTLGVDIENNFTPKYIETRGKGSIIKMLKSEAKKADKIFLATDPDREGEAISWQLNYILGLNLEDANRVTFNELTKKGIKNGMSNPRKIDMNLVDAQQARRILDRIVGYKISPLLWKKIKSGLSAGRVQSSVVKLIVDRENEIKEFIAEEYWTIDAQLTTKSSKKVFNASLALANGEKIKVTNESQAESIYVKLANENFVVSNVKNTKKQLTPPPPYITSTLQQEASKRLNFQAKKTMSVAQELYEGVVVPKLGAVGLITYMRTDSLRLSDEAKDAGKEVINATFGQDYVYSGNREYKQKNAQNAHEAIRPTMANLTPAELKKSLTNDQYRLYKLIWERYIASLMSNCIHDVVSIDIEAGDYTFKASGYTVAFEGYTRLYQETDAEKQTKLPNIVVGDVLNVREIITKQHFTKPPARYSEASLVKKLEENGIGRPSTYAQTISTILDRYYVEREQKQFKPTYLGEITNSLLEEHFGNIVDAKFTAKMEDSLDKIEDGELNYKDLLKDFYVGFEKDLDHAVEIIGNDKIKLPVEESDEICPDCGVNMIVKLGKYGKFLACPNFPTCRKTKQLSKPSDGLCPVCGGVVLIKKSKKGKAYYGCEHNPTCEFMTWDLPLAQKCPKCGSSLFKKPGKKGEIHCLKEGCSFVSD